MLTVRDASGDAQVKIQGDTQFVDEPIQDKTNALIIGPTEKGPAFVPKTIRNENDLKQVFGAGETYVTYAARKALEDTDRIKVQRIMHEKGWSGEPIFLKIKNATLQKDKVTVEGNQGSTSTFDEILASVIVVSGDLKTKIDLNNTTVERVSDRAKPDVTEFILKLKNENNDDVKSLNLSFDPASRKYIKTVINEFDDVDLFINFQDTQQAVFALKDGLEVTVDSTFQNTPLNFDEQRWKEARTPWIVSQTIGGNQRFPLFRFVSLSAGNVENRRFKISINQIGDFREESDYGFFTVQVRDFEDNDFNPNVLEEFEDVTLDPNHERFIGRVIGNKFERIEDGKVKKRGEFENNSDYIRVVLHPDRKKAGIKALPYGFQSYYPPISKSFLDGSVFFQNIKYRNEQQIGRISEYVSISRSESGGQDFEESIHLGFDFQHEENFNWLSPVADYFEPCFSYDFYTSSSNQNCTNVRNYINSNLNQSGFHLEDAAQISSEYEPDSIDKRKFSVALQGGFDGANPYREKGKDADITSENVWGFDLSDTNTKDYESYKKALDVIDERIAGFSYNVLTLPGLNLDDHELLLSEVDSLARDRGDFFHAADIAGFGASKDRAISVRSRYDTNYTAGYLGWLVTDGVDPFHDYVPPSAVIPSVYVRSDNLDAPWFAPSGYRRGVVEDVNDVNIRRGSALRDEIYEEDINTITFFNPDQILVWGQKTLFNKESELNRVNVRRLLVTLKTQISEIATQFLFEQQSDQMKTRFGREVRNYLSTIRSNQGIKNYGLDLTFGSEKSNPNLRTSPYTVEGKIRLIPIGVVEYIIINFTVRESQISFE